MCCSFFCLSIIFRLNRNDCGQLFSIFFGFSRARDFLKLTMLNTAAAVYCCAKKREGLNIVVVIQLAVSEVERGFRC